MLVSFRNIKEVSVVGVIRGRVVGKRLERRWGRWFYRVLEVMVRIGVCLLGEVGVIGRF